mmetsp:Transcript_43263/g.68468  ORF Transcript_43263/g.68468 Transcript_43263/m.68468 type:complete len:91 (+) Transcript_43263:472-744(+)
MLAWVQNLVSVNPLITMTCDRRFSDQSFCGLVNGQSLADPLQLRLGRFALPLCRQQLPCTGDQVITDHDNVPAMAKLTDALMLAFSFEHW